MRAHFFGQFLAAEHRSTASKAPSRPRRLRIFETLEPRLVMTAIQDWAVRGVGGGGALFSPSFNPTNGNDIYIASDMGQVFHTTNEGAAWDTVDHLEIHGSHNSKVQFTNNAQILYAVDYTNDLVRPTKSTDGGATWTPLAAGPTSDEVLTLVADYNNPNRLIVSDFNRLFVSTDGGATFTQCFSTASGAGLHVGGAFFDGNNIYVGTNQGLLTSTNGGTSFTANNFNIPAGQVIVSFAGAKENGTTRLWAVTWAAGDVFAGVQGFNDNGYAGFYRMNVGDAGWTAMTSGLPSTTRPFLVSAAINDIDTVYVAGGTSGGALDGTPSVFRSTNNGNWTSVLTVTNNANAQTGWSGDGGDRTWGYGETAMGFEVSPLDSTRLIITDFGFAHLSEDSGGSWRALYVTPDDLNPAGAKTPQKQPHTSSGLENTTSWGLTWVDSTHIIGSFSDIRGAVSADAGASWSFNYSGHTSNSMYRSVVQPTTQVVYAAVSSVHDMYESTHLTDASIDSGMGSVLYSTNGGAIWQSLHNFNAVVVWVEIDPANPNRVYASVADSVDGGIYVTNNAQAGPSSTWTKLAAPPRTQGHAFNLRVLNDGTLVASYSGRRDANGFTASSGVFVSTNGGASWTDRSAAGMQYWTKDVVIDPNDSTQNTWYAAVFSGWGGAPNGTGGLYKTTNRGQSWTRISTLDRVNSVTISPTNPNEAYVTTEVDGLWYTENLNATTPTFAEVAGYKFMQPMRVFYNPFDTTEVWVTSFGGGLRVGHMVAAVPNQWKGPAGGDWSDPNNWTGGVVPNGDSGEVGIVRLWNNLANDGIVNLGSINRVLRTLSLEDTNASYTIDSTGASLIVQSSSGNAQIVFTPANTQNHAITATLKLGSNTDIDAGQETLTLSGILNWNNKSITVTGGTVVIDGSALGQNTSGSTLTINQGATVVLSGTGSLSDGASPNVHYVDIINNGTLEITGNVSLGEITGQSTTSVGAAESSTESALEPTSAPTTLPASDDESAGQTLVAALLMEDSRARHGRSRSAVPLAETVDQASPSQGPATAAANRKDPLTQPGHRHHHLPGREEFRHDVDPAAADAWFALFDA